MRTKQRASISDYMRGKPNTRRAPTPVDSDDETQRVTIDDLPPLLLEEIIGNVLFSGSSDQEAAQIFSPLLGRGVCPIGAFGHVSRAWQRAVTSLQRRYIFCRDPFAFCSWAKELEIGSDQAQAVRWIIIGPLLEDDPRMAIGCLSVLIKHLPRLRILEVGTNGDATSDAINHIIAVSHSLRHVSVTGIDEEDRLEIEEDDFAASFIAAQNSSLLSLVWRWYECDAPLTVITPLKNLQPTSLRRLDLSSMNQERVESVRSCAAAKIIGQSPDLEELTLGLDSNGGLDEEFIAEGRDRLFEALERQSGRLRYLNLTGFEAATASRLAHVISSCERLEVLSVGSVMALDLGTVKSGSLRVLQIISYGQSPQDVVRLALDVGQALHQLERLQLLALPDQYEPSIGNVVVAARGASSCLQSDACRRLQGSWCHSHG